MDIKKIRFVMFMFAGIMCLIAPIMYCAIMGIEGAWAFTLWIVALMNFLIAMK